MKKLTWLADSRYRVKSFPDRVQDDIGFALYTAQLGEMSPKAKPLHGLGGGVMEISTSDQSGRTAQFIRSPLGIPFTWSTRSRRSRKSESPRQSSR
jgi:phage-related protein